MTILFSRLLYIISIFSLIYLKGKKIAHSGIILGLSLFLLGLWELSIGTFCDSCSRVFRKGGSEVSFIEGAGNLYLISGFILISYVTIRLIGNSKEISK